MDIYQDQQSVVEYKTFNTPEHLAACREKLCAAHGIPVEKFQEEFHKAVSYAFMYAQNPADFDRRIAKTVIAVGSDFEVNVSIWWQGSDLTERCNFFMCGIPYWSYGSDFKYGFHS